MQRDFKLPALTHEEYRMSQQPATSSTVPTQRQPLHAAALSQQLREAQAQQALTDLFPHLRLEAYNALRELFPIQSAQ